MKKTAVVYDKWLSTLGGGEVVACNMARVLKDNGYDVIFICGKKVSVKEIENKLKIDLSDIKFKEVWNDEIKLKGIISGKDLFINCSFMDYSFGYANKNIYYAHFPTESYTNIKGKIFNELILPLATKIVKPIEFITKKNELIIDNNYGYLLEKTNKIVFYNLEINKTYQLRFRIFFENFFKIELENFLIKINNSKILKKKIKIDHYHNVILFDFYIKTLFNTIYFILTFKKHFNISKNKIILISPKIFKIKIPDFLYELIYNKIQTRLRAGIFINILKRIKSYQLILSNSEFTKKWIKNYWKRKAKVLYPPVELLFEKYDLSKIKKENWICNIGRFFTLGHGKKQEILIDAFKKFYNQGYKNWQLHLIGGLGNELSSQEYVRFLKKQAKGYPIFFHFNISRKKLEEVLLKSKIYWHATGFGENENKHPIKFEHFGIAPIEAISAGCIPILFNGGGHKEIINRLNLNKEFLFNSKNELVKKTIEAIEKKVNINPYRLSIFNVKNFAKNFLNICIQ